jgi:ubiquinone biosynthesis protein Coq4
MLRKLIGSVRLVQALHRLVEDPTRLDVVFDLGRRTLTGSTLPSELGQPEVLAYVRKPQSPLAVDLPALRALPEGTLGRTFADWLTAKGYQPGELLTYDHGHGDSESEVERYRQHLASTHDLWHVLTDFDTDVPGEVGLQALYLAQLRTPLALVLIAAVMLHGLRYPDNDVAACMDAITRGWNMGKAARPLFGVDWATLWSTPLADVRARFALDVQSAAAPAPTALAA